MLPDLIKRVEKRLKDRQTLDAALVRHGKAIRTESTLTDEVLLAILKILRSEEEQQ